MGFTSAFKGLTRSAFGDPSTADMYSHEQVYPTK